MDAGVADLMESWNGSDLSDFEPPHTEPSFEGALSNLSTGIISFTFGYHVGGAIILLNPILYTGETPIRELHTCGLTMTTVE